MPDKPSLLRVVGAAILDGNRCLAAQRGPSAIREALKWEFPGGKIEPGERSRDALCREIREELSVEIEVGSRLGRGRHTRADPIIELEVFTAKIVHGKILLTEHYRYGWFRGEEIRSLDWAAADRPVLSTLIELLATL